MQRKVQKMPLGGEFSGLASKLLLAKSLSLLLLLFQTRIEETEQQISTPQPRTPSSAFPATQAQSNPKLPTPSFQAVEPCSCSLGSGTNIAAWRGEKIQAVSLSLSLSLSRVSEWVRELSEQARGGNRQAGGRAERQADRTGKTERSSSSSNRQSSLDIISTSPRCISFIPTVHFLVPIDLHQTSFSPTRKPPNSYQNGRCWDQDHWGKSTIDR